MTAIFTVDDSIAYLQKFMGNNKARGMMAEVALDTEFKGNAALISDKIISGGWLLSPNIIGAYSYRYSSFVLPEVYDSLDELIQAVHNLERNRGWQALATFLHQAGIGVIVSGAIGNQFSLSGIAPNLLVWRNFIYSDEILAMCEGDEPFSKWPGNRGRASKGQPWSPDVVDRFRASSANQLTSLALRQAFYYGYLKENLKKPIADPYDVDAFFVSFRGSTIPVEVKEKSPTNKGEFGVDAGRILMLLRLCLATDSNALYIIREVDNSDTRQLVGWRCITLSDMIMGCSWNLQAGGAGMGGGQTQTVMMAGSLFQEFSAANLSEDWLNANGSLQGSVKIAAKNVLGRLTDYL